MTEQDQPPSLDDLGNRLKKARESSRHGPGQDETARRGPTTGMVMALRVGMEMVAALLVGGAIGWFLDEWLGTRPWFMLVFLLLGMAAGVLNAYRASLLVTKLAEREAEKEREDETSR